MMSPEDHDLLKINCPKIVKSIDMEGGFISELVARDGLTDDQKQIIMTQPGQNKQADKLVDTVMRNRKQHTVDKMYYALKESGQEHIAITYLRAPKTNDYSWTQIAGNAAVPAQPNISVPPNAASAMAGSPADIAMTRAHKEQLDANRDKFQESLDVKLTVDKLRTYSVLSRKEGDKILAQPTEDDQAGALLDTLQRKNDDAYTKLWTALNDTKQGFLAKLLE